MCTEVNKKSVWGEKTEGILSEQKTLPSRVLIRLKCNLKTISTSHYFSFIVFLGIKIIESEDLMDGSKLSRL